MHCTAKRAEDTDWKEIVRLYEALEILTPGPVVRLNKAVAWSKLHGAKAALALLEPIAKELSRYQPYHAVRAALLEEVGDVPATIAALNAALSCTPTRQEAEYLMQRLRAEFDHQSSGSDGDDDDADRRAFLSWPCVEAARSDGWPGHVDWPGRLNIQRGSFGPTG